MRENTRKKKKIEGGKSLFKVGYEEKMGRGRYTRYKIHRVRGSYVHTVHPYTRERALKTLLWHENEQKQETANTICNEKLTEKKT